MYLYGCDDDGESFGLRRAIITTLALAGPRVGELCQLDTKDVDLVKACIYIADSKTEAGVRSVDIHPRLLHELTAYRTARGPVSMDAPAFPTRTAPPIYDHYRPPQEFRQGTVYQHILQWAVPGSNRRPPACKAGALPAELTAPAVRVQRGSEPPVGSRP